MDKKKKELILVAILAPVFIFVVYNSVTSISGKKSGPARAPAAEPVPVIAPAGPPPGPGADQKSFAAADEKIIAMQSIIAGGPWERDPFRPPPVKESERFSQDWKKFQLTGIIAGRMAIINGEPVAVGEEYQGYRLKEAGQYRIMLEKDDQSFIITISED